MAAVPAPAPRSALVTAVGALIDEWVRSTPESERLRACGHAEVRPEEPFHVCTPSRGNFHTINSLFHNSPSRRVVHAPCWRPYPSFSRPSLYLDSGSAELRLPGLSTGLSTRVDNRPGSVPPGFHRRGIRVGGQGRPPASEGRSIARRWRLRRRRTSPPRSNARRLKVVAGRTCGKPGAEAPLGTAGRNHSCKLGVFNDPQRPMACSSREDANTRPTRPQRARASYPQGEPQRNLPFPQYPQISQKVHERHCQPSGARRNPMPERHDLERGRSPVLDEEHVQRPDGKYWTSNGPGQSAGELGRAYLGVGNDCVDTFGGPPL